MLERKTVSYSY